MSLAADLDSLLGPFDDPDWRADLQQVAAGAREEWQRWARQAELLARLARQVPAPSGTLREKTNWDSFVREIAVARRCSDQAAAKEIFLAVALVRHHPRTLALLHAGQLPAYSAKVLLEETAACSDTVATLVDTELADRACTLTPSRIRAEVRRIELHHDADAAATRAAKAATAREVRLRDARDDQASLTLTGPALPLTQFYDAVTAAARAARAAGDPRGLDALRFDLALNLPDPEQPSEPTEPAEPATEPAADETPAAPPAPGQQWWLGDRRRVRPVQVLIHLPVTTALGLSNEPGWLPGYGWISAPQCRQWLTSAELRQICTDHTGRVIDSSDHVQRPEPTPAAVRDAILTMVRDPGPITDKTWRTETQHDPSDPLRRFVMLRDDYCDGPTGTRVPAARCHQDHERPWPDGPTAAWNLVARAARTHQLKHRGWVPLRTATSTLWFSPAGQLVDVPHHTDPPPELDPDAQLPDPDALHDLEAELLQPPGPDDWAPWNEPPF